METMIFTLILLPFIGFVINGLLGARLPKKLVGGLGTLVIAMSFGIGLYLFFGIDSTTDYKVVKLFDWFSIQGLDVDFSFQIDQLSVMMVLIITGIGTLIHLYSIEYMIHDEGFYKFFTYLNLFVFSMLLLVLGSNYLILFIGWEGVGLCSFLLIGFWYRNVEYTKAARKAFIMNRIGDLGLLVGIFAIAYHLNSLEYWKVSEMVNKFPIGSPGIVLISVALFVGAMGKSAQVPLFTWLPDAMAGPTPVSALIHAATMVTAGIYLIVRSNFLYDLAPQTMNFILYIGLATAIIAAFIGLRQNDIKKVLAYSTVSQLGFMFMALGAGAYTTAMFHLMTHAFFKALMFLGSGSVIHAMGGEQDMRMMGGLKSRIPITYYTFLIGTLAITGIPPFSGMISKDEILTVLFTKNKFVWAGALLTAALTAAYMFRLLFLTFFGEFRGTSEQEHHLHESPWKMTLPLVILAILSIVGGFINLPHFIGHGHYQKLSQWIEPVLVNKPKINEIPFVTEMILLIVTILMVVLVFVYLRNIYVVKGKIPEEETKYKGWESFSASKLYIDQIYNLLFVKSTEALGRASNDFDLKLLDRAVDGVGEGASGSGRSLKSLQNGNVENYILIMSIAVGLVLLLNLVLN